LGIGHHADHLLTGLPGSLPLHLCAVVPPSGTCAPRAVLHAWRHIGHSGSVCQSRGHMSAQRAGHPPLLSSPHHAAGPHPGATLRLTSAGAPPYNARH
jgi:hypothetical protein